MYVYNHYLECCNDTVLNSNVSLQIAVWYHGWVERMQLHITWLLGLHSNAYNVVLSLKSLYSLVQHWHDCFTYYITKSKSALLLNGSIHTPQPCTFKNEVLCLVTYLNVV